MSEIAPCPFCGDDVGKAAFWYAVKEKPPSAHVFCLECATDGPHCETLDEAIAAWNLRAPPASPTGRQLGPGKRDELPPIVSEGVGGHTPGPWQNGIDDLEGVVSVGPPAEVGDGNVICLPPDGMEASLARWPANARLIAAAPDQNAALIEALPLLEVLHSTLPPGKARSAVWRAIKNARSALSKATGEGG